MINDKLTAYCFKGAEAAKQPYRLCGNSGFTVSGVQRDKYLYLRLKERENYDSFK